MSRVVDITFSLAVIVFFIPFALVIVPLLTLTGEGKIFYLQTRVGRNGRIFKLIKFATMLEDSPNIGSGDITLKDDPRVLSVGRFLRKTKLNEIPQVINILKGDMTLVGPRPLTPKIFNLYPEHVQREIVKVTPGLTGVGSIVFRDEETIVARSSKSYFECYRDEIAPYKGALELWYIRNRGLWLDIKILFLTAWVVVFPTSTLFRKVLKGLPRHDAN